MNDSNRIRVREFEGEESEARRMRSENNSDVYVIDKPGGLYEAQGLIKSIIECSDTRYYQGQLRDSADCLKFKGNTKKRSSKKSTSANHANLPEPLVQLGPHLFNLARHYIIKKLFIDPRMHLSEILKGMMRFVCGIKKIISPAWFNLFSLKVWDNLTRFVLAQKSDRLNFFFQVLESNGDQLICGAMEKLSIFHTRQPLIGRPSPVGNPEEIKVTLFFSHGFFMNLTLPSSSIDVFYYKKVF